MEELQAFPPGNHPEFYSGYSQKAVRRAQRKYLVMLTEKARVIEDTLTSQVNAMTSKGPSATSNPEASSSAALELGPQEYHRTPVGTTMPVSGLRRKKKGASLSAPSKHPLAEIVEETSSEAEESWEEVQSFEKPKPDVEMASESETESENQYEIEALQYLTKLYNDWPQKRRCAQLLSAEAPLGGFSDRSPQERLSDPDRLSTIVGNSHEDSLSAPPQREQERSKVLPRQVRSRPW